MCEFGLEMWLFLEEWGNDSQRIFKMSDCFSRFIGRMLWQKLYILRLRNKGIGFYWILFSTAGLRQQDKCALISEVILQNFRTSVEIMAVAKVIYKPKDGKGFWWLIRLGALKKRE